MPLGAALSQEWWDVKGEIQTLPATAEPANPFKAGDPSPLQRLSDNPCLARVDPAHTWAIVGIGKDLYSSAIMLQARMGIFGNGSIAKRLDNAYRQFDAFLGRVGKHSSIEDFSYQTLKCGKEQLT